MFPRRYYGGRFFAPRFFPESAGQVAFVLDTVCPLQVPLVERLNLSVPLVERLNLSVPIIGCRNEV